MGLPKSILYPVDFSARCRAAWPAVASMSRQLDVPVTLLHAVDPGDPETAEVLSPHLMAICGQARETLDRFETPGPGVTDVHREVAAGAAARCIVERAAQMDAPLIMMPTRGHTRFRQLLLGSVTAAVLHDAPGPVWTEAHSEEESVHAGVRRSVVCAIDLNLRTSALLQTADEFSRKFGVPLYVVHSVPRVDPRFRSATAYRAHTFLVDKAREDFPVHCSNAGVDIPLEIVEDADLISGVMDAIARHQADLLMIGRGVVQGTLGRLRTNAHELIRRSPCAVLSV